MLAMALNPNVLKKAQVELDAVVGSERLPTIADKPDLPYINALILETMRWKPALPLGMFSHKICL
jgi:cytochrome P450